MEGLTIRTADPAKDAADLLRIYAPYVEHTAITFEYAVPAEEEFRTRIERTLKKYPYLVAERDGRILGYAYAGAFQPRAAYGWCAEMSIYLDRDVRGQGIGRALYEALESALDAMGIVNLYACIAVPDGEDAYLDRSSEAFHSRLGFETVGEFHSCGYKFKRWYNMIWMEKIIGAHRADQPSVRPFAEKDAGN